MFAVLATCWPGIALLHGPEKARNLARAAVQEQVGRSVALGITALFRGALVILLCAKQTNSEAQRVWAELLMY